MTEQTKRAIVKIDGAIYSRLVKLQENIKKKGKVVITLEDLVSAAFETGLDTLDAQYPTPLDTGQEPLFADGP